MGHTFFIFFHYPLSWMLRLWKLPSPKIIHRIHKNGGGLQDDFPFQSVFFSGSKVLTVNFCRECFFNHQSQPPTSDFVVPGNSTKLVGLCQGGNCFRHSVIFSGSISHGFFDEVILVERR